MKLGNGPNFRLWNLFEGKLEVLKGFNQASAYLLLLIKNYFDFFMEKRKKL